MNLPVDKYEVVYIAIRALHSGNRGQIIQIVAKFEYGVTFSRWIKPPLSWTKSTFEVQGLKVTSAGLFVQNTKLETVTEMSALQDFVAFLKTTSKPVVLVGHNAQSMYTLLLRHIFKNNLVDEFDSAIAGFGDSRPAFMKKYASRRSPDDFELAALARDLLKENYIEKFFLAAANLRMIEKLVNSSAMRDDIIRNAIDFESAALKEMEVQYSSGIVRNLLAMRSVLTLGMLKKVAQAGVPCDVMMEIHRQGGSKRLIRVLSAKGRDGKPRVTANAQILKSIADFFDSQQPPSPGEIARDPTGREIYTIQYPSYRQERELLENAKQLYTEIIRGKDNRPLYVVEYTD